MGINKDYRLTQVGVDELKHELEKLKQRRQDVAQKLKDAKEQGDLSENSDWEAAQDEQKYVEGRINEVEHILQNVQVITVPANSKQVQLGSTVTLQQNGNEVIYTLVGSIESNPREGKISNESPIGRELLDKKVGEEVTVLTPSSTTIFKVTKIS